MKKENNKIIARVSIRKAVDADCLLFWEVRNEETTRGSSFSQEIIPYSQHESWYRGKIKDADSLMLVISTKTRIGYLRYDVEENAILTSIAIKPEYRNKGLGTAALKLGKVFAIKTFGILPVKAKIKRGNRASIKAFQKAEYIVIMV